MIRQFTGSTCSRLTTKRVSGFQQIARVHAAPSTNEQMVMASARTLTRFLDQAAPFACQTLAIVERLTASFALRAIKKWTAVYYVY